MEGKGFISVFCNVKDKPNGQLKKAVHRFRLSIEKNSGFIAKKITFWTGGTAFSI